MTRRLVAFALAAVAVAGIGTAVVPQHAWSIARVAAVAVVVLAGALVLSAVAALGSDDPEPTALDGRPPGRVTPLDPHGLRDARRDLHRDRNDGSVPRPVWVRLRRAAVGTLRDNGFDLEHPRTRIHARRVLSEKTWTMLASEPASGGSPDPESVAAAVHAVLDELERLEPSRGARP